MTDPAIPTKVIAQAIGVAPWHLWRWQRGGFIQRPRKGCAPLLGTLKGVVAALRAEASDDAPYADPQPLPVPCGAVHLADLDRALDRLLREAERRAKGLALPEAMRGRLMPAYARQARDAEIADLLARIRSHRRVTFRLARAEAANVQ